MENIKVEIITPSKTFLSKNVQTVVIPGSEGEFGVLTDHISLISTIDAGIVKLYGSENTIEDEILVTSGFVEVSKNEVVILADEANLPKDINIEEVESSIALYKEKLQSDLTEIERSSLTDQISKKERILKILSK